MDQTKRIKKSFPAGGLVHGTGYGSVHMEWIIADKEDLKYWHFTWEERSGVVSEVGDQGCTVKQTILQDLPTALKYDFSVSSLKFCILLQ